MITRRYESTQSTDPFLLTSLRVKLNQQPNPKEARKGRMLKIIMMGGPKVKTIENPRGIRFQRTEEGGGQQGGRARKKKKDEADEWVNSGVSEVGWKTDQVCIIFLFCPAW